MKSKAPPALPKLSPWDEARKLATLAAGQPGGQSAVTIVIHWSPLSGTQALVVSGRLGQLEDMQGNPIAFVPLHYWAEAIFADTRSVAGGAICATPEEAVVALVAVLKHRVEVLGAALRRHQRT